MKGKDNLKSNEPPSKTTEEGRTLSTKEKALTTSPSTPSKKNATKSILDYLTKNKTGYFLATQNKTAPLSPSSSSDKTTVTTKKTAAANKEAKAASSNPVTHATVNSKGKSTYKLTIISVRKAESISQVSAAAIKTASTGPKPPSSKKKTQQRQYRRHLLHKLGVASS